MPNNPNQDVLAAETAEQNEHSTGLNTWGWQHYQQKVSSKPRLNDGTHVSSKTVKPIIPANKARVVEPHKTEVWVRTGKADNQLIKVMLQPKTPAITVGDWIELTEDGQFGRILPRASLFQRVTPGQHVNTQLIAANVDTAIIVSSLNDDFNLSRIERYLAMVAEAGTQAVVVLSKADLCVASNGELGNQQAEVEALQDNLPVLVLDNRAQGSVEGLFPWCGNGKTCVVMGSSGAGKSTLVNTLMGASVQKTGAIRDQDSKGKHVTTSRSLLLLPNGGLIIDTPGMRELQLAGCAHGVARAFADVTALAAQCKFNDCKHMKEPGCAVQNALKEETLDQRRYQNYAKLLEEQSLNQLSLDARSTGQRKTNKYHKQLQQGAKTH